MKELLKNIINILFCNNYKTENTSYINKTSKTIISANEQIILNTKTKQGIELVKNNVEKILKKCNNNPEELIKYIEKSNTPVYRIKNANKLLQLVGEEEGLILEQRGLHSLFICLITNSKLSLKTSPIFILNDSNPELVPLTRHFYNWCSLNSNLPGFDYQTQQNLKKYLKNPNINLNLSIDAILDLQEAVSRDKESSEFALHIAQKTIGAKNVQKKITDGGAEI